MTTTTARSTPAREQTETASDIDSAVAAENPEILRGLYRQMLLIRRFEERTAQSYTAGQDRRLLPPQPRRRSHRGRPDGARCAPPTTCSPTTASTATRWPAASTRPGHGRAVRPSTGVSQGLRRLDAPVRRRGPLLGGYAIVGGQLPLATGAALAIAYRGGDEVVMCQMGDATTNIGAFHESLNLAALWKLPVVFVVINNQLGMGTTSRSPRPSRSCTSAPAPTACTASGSTATTCWPCATPPSAPSSARREEPARAAGGGQLPAARALGGRPGPLPQHARTVAAAREHDPIPLLARRLLEAGVLTEDGADRYRRARWPTESPPPSSSPTRARTRSRRDAVRLQLRHPGAERLLTGCPPTPALHLTGRTSHWPS